MKVSHKYEGCWKTLYCAEAKFSERSHLASLIDGRQYGEEILELFFNHKNTKINMKWSFILPGNKRH